MNLQFSESLFQICGAEEPNAASSCSVLTPGTESRPEPEDLRGLDRCIFKPLSALQSQCRDPVCRLTESAKKPPTMPTDTLSCEHSAASHLVTLM